MDEPYTTSEFHDALLKQLAGTVTQALGNHKIDRPEFAAILHAAQLLCRDDLRYAGRLSLHGLEQDGGTLKPAEEAYLSVAAHDRDTNIPWLSLTYWLSDLALADRNPERVRAVVAAMEQSLDKVKAWLAEQEAPPAPGPEADSAA